MASGLVRFGIASASRSIALDFCSPGGTPAALPEAFSGPYHFLQSSSRLVPGLGHDRFVAMLYQFAIHKSFYQGRCVACSKGR
jgi:hypothetical protein